jgi:DNA-binding MarR family transcriptional regulator
LQGTCIYGTVAGVRTATTPIGATAGQQLLLALMTIGRRMRSRASDASGLDPSTAFVLHHVAENAPVRVSELARCTRLDSSTVSRHVRHLEEAGYLARSGDPDDRRASRLRLTDKGRARLEEAMRAKAALLDRAIADWPPEDRERLAALATRLVESIDRLTGTETTETR